MAVFSKLIIAAGALASIVQAAPVVLTVTDVMTVTSWVTTEGTTTIWKPADQSPTVAAPTPSAVEQDGSSETASPADAVFVQVQSAPAASTSSVIPVQQPTTSSQRSQTTTPVVQPSPSTWTTSTTSYIPRSVEATAAPAATPSSSAQSSSGGTCVGSGSGCSGDVTHWDGGLGACGWTVNTNSDMQVALPVGLMGSQSNGNPYCGRSITIQTTNGGKIPATVGDKCMGCTGFSIDLTNALFSAVTGETGDGRVSGISWWFD